jgi:hypothetical protein
MTSYCSGRPGLGAYSSRKTAISSAREHDGRGNIRTFSGIVYAHQLRITIGQMVEDLELIATATSQDEWWERIEYLPLG